MELNNINITKQGLWIGTNFIEYLIEPDGSIWMPICHHNNPTEKKFSSTNDFTNGVFIDHDRWFNAGICNKLTSWEFLWRQNTESYDPSVKIRWTQSKNPFTAVYANVKPGTVTFNSSSGYTVPNTSSAGGIYKLNSNTFFCCTNTTNGNWFGAAGAWTAYNGGIPGFPSIGDIRSGSMDLYVRVDKSNLEAFKIGNILSNTFYEI